MSPYTPYNTPKVSEYKLRNQTVGSHGAGEYSRHDFKWLGLNYTIVLTQSKSAMRGFNAAVYLGQEYVGAIKGIVPTQKDAVDTAISIIKNDAPRHKGQAVNGISADAAAEQLAEEISAKKKIAAEVHGWGAAVDIKGRKYIEVNVASEKTAKAVTKFLNGNSEYKGYPVKITVGKMAVAQSNIDGTANSKNQNKFKVLFGAAVLIGGFLFIRYLINKPSTPALIMAPPVTVPLPPPVAAAPVVAPPTPPAPTT